MESAQETKKEGDKPDAPNIINDLPVIKWNQEFGDYLDSIIGHRTISLFYVVREEVTVPFHAPPLVPGQPQLVARASHTHTLYRDENSLVQYKLDESTLSTPYTASINPFQRPNDVQAAWLDLTIQYAGQGKWEQELKTQYNILHTRVWKLHINVSLEKFTQQHRSKFVLM